jgi:hypothetical protein
MAAIEDARGRRGPPDEDHITVIIRRFVSSGSVSGALVDLRGAIKLDPYRPTARLALEPWLVEMALDRLGDRRLTLAEQQAVWKTARTPSKVKWPEWWEFRGSF